jgi:hypothetical protein
VRELLAYLLTAAAALACGVMPGRREAVPPAPCRCGDPGAAHEHYRAGTDCALCGCDRFRPASRGRHAQAA